MRIPLGMAFRYIIFSDRLTLLTVVSLSRTCLRYSELWKYRADQITGSMHFAVGGVSGAAAYRWRA